MRAILWAEFCQLRRQPGMYLLMIVLTLVFAIAFGKSAVSEIVIPVYRERLKEEEVDRLVKQLNEQEGFRYQRVGAEEAKERVDSREAEAAVELTEKGYRLLMTGQTASTSIVEQFVMQVMVREKWVDTLAEMGEESQEAIRDKIEKSKEQPILDLNVTSQSEDGFLYDQQAQSVLGMTLFFVIYTITYTVNRIIERKKEGIWDRLIASSITKTKMFSAYLLFGFLMGYGQIVLIFTLFWTVFGMDFGGSFGTVLLLCIPYVFVITALGVCLSAFIRSPQHLDAVIPLVAVSMAMLGGAYWPLEIVSNKVLLFFSKLVPLTYAMDLLKGVVVYGVGWEELLYPLAVLLLMGVMLMGIGINVMERREV